MITHEAIPIDTGGPNHLARQHCRELRTTCDTRRSGCHFGHREPPLTHAHPTTNPPLAPHRRHLRCCCRPQRRPCGTTQARWTRGGAARRPRRVVGGPKRRLGQRARNLAVHQNFWDLQASAARAAHTALSPHRFECAPMMTGNRTRPRLADHHVGSETPSMKLELSHG